MFLTWAASSSCLSVPGWGTPVCTSLWPPRGHEVQGGHLQKEKHKQKESLLLSLVLHDFQKFQRSLLRQFLCSLLMLFQDMKCTLQLLNQVQTNSGPILLRVCRGNHWKPKCQLSIQMSPAGWTADHLLPHVKAECSSSSTSSHLWYTPHNEFTVLQRPPPSTDLSSIRLNLVYETWSVKWATKPLANLDRKFASLCLIANGSCN